MCKLGLWLTHHIATEAAALRTNIDIDDDLMREALAVTGLPTKRSVVEEGLRRLIMLKRQQDVRKLRGRLRWEGDLDEMRRDR
jgi:Arc/MetJ family transcription regulator